MTISPEKVQIAYQALCGLGVSLASTAHKWTNEQRKAWELAERTLRPFGNPNVEVTGAARLYRAASVWTAGLGDLQT